MTLQPANKPISNHEIDKGHDHGHDPTTNNVVQKPTVLIDYERYAAMLEHPDLNEAQKKAFIDCLWNLITEIIYLGVDVLPDETSDEDKLQNILDHLPADMVDSNIAQSNKKPQHSSSS